MSSKRKKKAGKRSTRLAASERAVLALASPLRMEIVQAFAGAERLTVAEIAERMKTPRGSLYYHVRKLATVGILTEVDRRLAGRRYEAVYALAADRIELAPADSPAGRKTAARLVLSTLRQAGREFEDALSRGLFDAHEGLELGRRQRAWLTPEELARVQRHLDQIEKICFRAKDAKGRDPFAITSLIVPLPADE